MTAELLRECVHGVAGCDVESDGGTLWVVLTQADGSRVRAVGVPADMPPELLPSVQMIQWIRAVACALSVRGRP